MNCAVSSFRSHRGQTGKATVQTLPFRTQRVKRGRHLHHVTPAPNAVGWGQFRRERVEKVFDNGLDICFLHVSRLLASPERE
jgi:hypothetical protein